MLDLWTKLHKLFPRLISILLNITGVFPALTYLGFVYARVHPLLVSPRRTLHPRIILLMLSLSIRHCDAKQKWAARPAFQADFRRFPGCPGAKKLPQ